MLSAEVTEDVSRTDLRLLDEIGGAELESVFAELEQRAAAAVVAQGVEAPAVIVQRRLDLRYQGQEHSLPLPVAAPLNIAAIRAAFEAEHELRYGHVMDSPVQVLAVRVRGTARPADVAIREVEAAVPGDGGPERALLGRREAWCLAAGAPALFAVYERERLRAGDLFAGPCIVDEGTSTTVVMSDQRVAVDRFGHLVVTQEVTP
jgi:N-methylhydantoinase A